MRPTLLLGTLACVALLAACSKQSEGERCDTSSGNLDCETGLICRSADQLSIEGRGVALCCPPDDVQPTVNACRAGAELPDDTDPVTPPASPDASAPAGDGGI